MTDAHLHNAARSLERILRARHPHVVFTVEVIERQPDERPDPADGNAGQS